MNPADIARLKATIRLANQSRKHGNHPFGAILVNKNGLVVLEAENTVNTSADVTGHAETNLVRLASHEYSHDQLADFTLYTSTEPCAMCSGAIHWSGIGRVVFALSQNDLYEIIGPSPSHLDLPCREVFNHSRIEMMVEGPAKELEEDARKVHLDFWE
jgi:tRNA(Arg) A34 adenosine deaminase TadA